MELPQLISAWLDEHNYPHRRMDQWIGVFSAPQSSKIILSLRFGDDGKTNIAKVIFKPKLHKRKGTGDWLDDQEIATIDFHSPDSLDLLEIILEEAAG